MKTPRSATFGPGASVHVTPFGNGVVREVRNGGRYLIEVKGRAMVVHASQLSPADPPRKTRRALPGEAILAQGTDAKPVSLDLHGKTVQEALDVLDAFLSDALLDGAGEARVIHGRSGGKLRAAVHGRLKLIAAVRHFRLDPANAGVTIVTF
jgi:DNA mismatch repair protein MutS2